MLFIFRRTRPDGSTNERLVISNIPCNEKKARELFTLLYGNASGWKLLNSY